MTALRFAAAFMIVLHHSVGLFGIHNLPDVNLGQGVSFFFVLSGFILVYVYPTLETWPDLRRFWTARVARIWPAHLIALLLGFWLLRYDFDASTGMAHLFLVQAWIPVSSYYFSYNAVAWSVSVEAFFYLAFPFLLYRWGESWPFKLILSGLFLAGQMWLCDTLALPAYGSPPAEGLLVTQHGLIYIGPLARIFEFIFGMSIAAVWRRGVSWRPFPATVYELAALALCGVSMLCTASIAGRIGAFFGPAAALWVVHSGSMFAFGVLIYVMAHGQGKLSFILAHPFMVTLGEISFSAYLIHQILLNYYRANAAGFRVVPNPIAFLVFISLLLLSAYLIWVCVEMPARAMINGTKRPRVTDTGNAHRRFTNAGRAGLAACGVLCLLLFARGPSWGGSVTSGPQDWWSADATASYLKAPAASEIDFEGIYRVHALSISRTGRDIHIEVWWEELRHEEANNARYLFLHLVDAAGNILHNQQIELFPYGPSRKDLRWRYGAVTCIGVNAAAVSLAFGVYHPQLGLLSVEKGRTDWGGKRVLVSLQP